MVRESLYVSFTNNPIAVWDFTINSCSGLEITDTFINTLGKGLNKIAKNFVFQQEIGEETNRLHLQGKMSLKKKKRGTESFCSWLKSMNIFGNRGGRFTPTSRTNIDDWKYVSKEETRRPHRKGFNLELKRNKYYR
jgi:hypothetical protein